MSIHLILLLICPILIPIIARIVFNKQVTWQEYGVATGVGVAVVVLVYCLSIFGQTADTEVWNGEVTGKERDTVSCEHSYSCNCRSVASATDSKGNTTYTTVCDTCYEHSHDYDWNVNTNIGSVIEIDRIDRQGKDEPPRWTQVKVGEPVAVSHRFTNYVKASSDSLFNAGNNVINPSWSVPVYPSNIFDYYKLNRVINVDLPIRGDELKDWNIRLSENLKMLGPRKEANVIIVLTKNNDPNYVYAIQKRWQGAKKNDIVVVFGMQNYPEIQWVRVFSWAKFDIFNVNLRDSLLDIKTFDFGKVLAAIDYNVMKHFKRKEMREYEYLKSEIEPSTTLLVIAWILSIGVPVGATIFCFKN